MNNLWITITVIEHLAEPFNAIDAMKAHNDIARRNGENLIDWHQSSDGLDQLNTMKIIECTGHNKDGMTQYRRLVTHCPGYQWEDLYFISIHHPLHPTIKQLDDDYYNLAKKSINQLFGEAYTAAKDSGTIEPEYHVNQYDIDEVYKWRVMNSEPRPCADVAEWIIEELKAAKLYDEFDYFSTSSAPEYFPIYKHDDPDDRKVWRHVLFCTRGGSEGYYYHIGYLTHDEKYHGVFLLKTLYERADKAAELLAGLNKILSF